MQRTLSALRKNFVLFAVKVNVALMLPNDMLMKGLRRNVDAIKYNCWYKINSINKNRNMLLKIKDLVTNK